MCFLICFSHYCPSLGMREFLILNTVNPPFSGKCLDSQWETQEFQGGDLEFWVAVLAMCTSVQLLPFGGLISRPTPLSVPISWKDDMP